MLRIGEGYAPWTWEEIEKFRAHARADLWRAAAVALYSGQRQADVLGMLWSDIQEGLIFVRQNKTGKKLWIPMHENLRAVLTEIPRVSVHVLTNTRGLPWTTDGFKTSWGDELKREVFKELREGNLFSTVCGNRRSYSCSKPDARMRKFRRSPVSRGHMVAHYARQVNQKKLAATAVLKWQAADQAGRTKNESQPSL